MASGHGGSDRRHGPAPAGRRALVTGGTRGLGRAIVDRLVEEGCAVALCARSADVVAATVEQLRARGRDGVRRRGRRHRRGGARRRFVDDAARELGGLDLVVANAGGAAGGAGRRPTSRRRTGARPSTSTSCTPRCSSARRCRTCARLGRGVASSSSSSISGSRPQPKPQYAAAKAARDLAGRLAGPRARAAGHPGQHAVARLDPVRGRQLGPAARRRPCRLRRLRRARVPVRPARDRRRRSPTSRRSCSARVRRGSAARTSSSTGRRTRPGWAATEPVQAQRVSAHASCWRCGSTRTGGATGCSARQASIAPSSTARSRRVLRRDGGLGDRAGREVDDAWAAVATEALREASCSSRPARAAKTAAHRAASGTSASSCSASARRPPASAVAARLGLAQAGLHRDRERALACLRRDRAGRRARSAGRCGRRRARRRREADDRRDERRRAAAGRRRRCGR